jgi:hypothetical protein
MLLLLACTPPEDAPPEFSDAARYGLDHFDDAEESALAVPVLALEEQIYGSLIMDSATSADRALAIETLDGSEVDGIPHPGRDASAAVPPVALARESLYDRAAHVEVAMREDLSPMEPNSPELYTRTSTEGADCFADHTCTFFRTTNDVRKQNAIMEVEYELLKDYRWVDLGDGRLAMAARSWMPDSATGVDGGTILWQSFTFEIFVPIDTGTLRMMALWSETEFTTIEVSESDVELVQLVGIDDIFKAHDEWLTNNP